MSTDHDPAGARETRRDAPWLRIESPRLVANPVIVRRVARSETSTPTRRRGRPLVRLGVVSVAGGVLVSGAAYAATQLTPPPRLEPDIPRPSLSAHVTPTVVPTPDATGSLTASPSHRVRSRKSTSDSLVPPPVSVPSPTPGGTLGVTEPAPTAPSATPTGPTDTPSPSDGVPTDSPSGTPTSPSPSASPDALPGGDTGSLLPAPPTP